MFSGSIFLVVVLPVSWDVDVCSKSKMAAKLPEVRITMHRFTDTRVVPKTIQVTMYYETSECPTIMETHRKCTQVIPLMTDNRKRRLKLEILISLKL